MAQILGMFTDGLKSPLAMPYHACACPPGNVHHDHQDWEECLVTHRYYVPPRLGTVGLAGVEWLEPSVYGEPARLRQETVEVWAGALRYEDLGGLPVQVITCLWEWVERCTEMVAL